MVKRIILYIVAAAVWYSQSSCTDDAKPKSKPKQSYSLFGIDISANQTIDWNMVKTQRVNPLEFVIIRASCGIDRPDPMFLKNLKEAASAHYIIGAYHYYDPKQDAEKQARAFLQIVRAHLHPGMLRPMLDIEPIKNKKAIEPLIHGVKKWLAIVTKAYGVKPLVYSSKSFYTDALMRDLKDYPWWSAWYAETLLSDSFILSVPVFQFSKTFYVPGIKTGKKNVVDGDCILRTALDSLLLQPHEP